ncbi:MAG: nitrogen regulation protein NR(II) [Candidatus Methylomirabilia bacterium]
MKSQVADRRQGLTLRRVIGRARRLTGIRLIVFLPLVLMGLAMAVGLWAIRLTTQSLGAGVFALLPIAEAQALRETTLWVIGVGGGLALLLGIAIAVAIVHPIRQMLGRLEQTMPSSAERPPARETDEISGLTNRLNYLLLSFEKYARATDILDRLPEGIITLSPAGEILDANAEARRILGLAPEQLVGKTMWEVLEPSEGQAQLLRALREAFTAETPTTLPHLILALRDGRRVMVRGTIGPVDSHIGESRAAILAIQDLAQVQAIEREIRRVDQLAALGALGASIVHEIGGSVLAVQTLTDLIGDTIAPDSPDRRYVERIEAELERVRRLTDEIRTLAQVQVREPVLCQVESLVADAVSTVWSEMRFWEKGVELEKLIPSSLPPISGNPDRLSQAFVNIIINAFEATPAGGRIAVAVSQEEAPADIEPGQVIAVRVINSGSYIPAEDLDRIFTLFYTTKKEGSGLGLPIAYRAVADHGGEIKARSSHDHGTEFAILLPVKGTTAS